MSSIGISQTASVFHATLLRAAAALFAAGLMPAFLAPAFAQMGPPQGSPAPVAQAQICQRLESQLTALERSNNESGRSDQIRRYEDAANRQQLELDRAVNQGRRMGCDRIGFFGFGGPPEQCGPLNAQIQQMRDNLDRMLSDLQRLQGTGTDYERGGQRQALLAALGRNDCGPQYRTAATQAAPQPRGFLDALFGNNPFSEPAPPPGTTGGFRTICVRTCDGYFFPISFSTSQDRFRDDERTCQRMCPASEVSLYSYRNPGEQVSQAISTSSGRLYSELPNAFRYRQEFNPSCSCKRAGESWADAMKSLEDRSTIEQGDIVVTEERAKTLSLPRDARGRPVQPTPALRGAKAPEPVNSTSTPAPSPAVSSSDTTADPAKRKVRSVGPQFLPAN